MSLLSRLATAGVLAWLLAHSPIATHAQNLSPREAAIRDAVARQAADAVDFVEKTVAINSGTLNIEGVRAVGAVYREAFEALGMETSWIYYPDSLGRAGHLVAKTRGGEGPRLLLIGHLDTVFEPSSPFQTSRREGGFLIGPGAVDMKGGNAVILYALAALQEAGALHDAAITVMLTGDEEDPESIEIERRELIDEARRADVALGFEGSVGPHHATIARRGVSEWALEVESRTGHSSQIFTDAMGYGAVFEAARILDAFRRALSGEENLTINPGLVVGGAEATYDALAAAGEAEGKTNVLAARVIVQGDLRFLTEEQKEMARSTMRNIARQNLPGTRATITFREGYPAMSPTEGNQRLFRLFDTTSRDLGHGGIQPIDPGLRGAADISFASTYTDALSGLGPMGSGSHAVGERLDIASLEIATIRAAVFIYRLTRPGGYPTR
ncbi:MAG: M20/M25/M40 family metallo-hydrolase [Rhodothermales bacterium]